MQAGFGRNDLQGPAEDRCHEVGQAARWLEARFGNSRMTGSGSAVFARVIEVPAVNEVTALKPDPLAGLPPGWVGRMCQGLAHHPLAQWVGDAG